MKFTINNKSTNTPPPKLRTISEQNKETIEGSPGYEIKQILPIIKGTNYDIDFLNHNGLKIKCKFNYSKFLIPQQFAPLYENESIGLFTTSNKNLIPLEFWLDLGTNIDNINSLSFHPGTDINGDVHWKNCCSVKDYEIYISQDNINYQLLIKNTYDISKGKDPNYNYLFKPEELVFDPVSFRYLKIKILNIYFLRASYQANWFTGTIGISNLRIYTNTKNLYNKELDQSISNYKDNSFNQIITKPEWDQKSKEDKIILNKQASFDNPSISKIKNELNDFRIITNHNNIPIYEKHKV